MCGGFGHYLSDFDAECIVVGDGVDGPKHVVYGLGYVSGQFAARCAGNHVVLLNHGIAAFDGNSGKADGKGYVVGHRCSRDECD